MDKNKAQNHNQDVAVAPHDEKVSVTRNNIIIKQNKNWHLH